MPPSTKAPERIETSRLVLRRPTVADIDAIFARFASDPEVTRYVAWPRHTSQDDTRGFIEFSDTGWQRWPAGPYLVESRVTGQLLGCTGLGFETPARATTGYVFAVDAWGKGYATETLNAVVAVARGLALTRLSAICHVDHWASWRVLEKCEFAREGILRRYVAFPNHPSPAPADVFCYAHIFD